MTKLNLGSGAHPLDGFENLDLPWRFEDGLAYEDESIEAITVSHSLMYVPLDQWPAVFIEFARVLKPGGILRVTEDATDDRGSERYGGWEDAVTLTSASLVMTNMVAVGLKPMRVDAFTSGFRDESLQQTWHGAEPKVFFVEGRKPRRYRKKGGELAESEGAGTGAQATPRVDADHVEPRPLASDSASPS